MLANTNSRVHYDFMGVNAEFHYVSHHVRNKKVLPQYDKINIWHSEQLRYLIDKMKTIKEGDGSLFDNSLILWGSGIKHGDYHSLTDLPLVLAGGGGGKVNLGRHVRYPKSQPYANLLLTLMTIMGTPPESIGDATGIIARHWRKSKFCTRESGRWQLEAYHDGRQHTNSEGVVANQYRKRTGILPVATFGQERPRNSNPLHEQPQVAI